MSDQLAVQFSLYTVNEQLLNSKKTNETLIKKTNEEINTQLIIRKEMKLYTRNET